MMLPPPSLTTGPVIWQQKPSGIRMIVPEERGSLVRVASKVFLPVYLSLFRFFSMSSVTILSSAPAS